MLAGSAPATILAGKYYHGSFETSTILGSFPEPVEPIGRQLAVADGVLYVSVPEIVLRGSRIDAVVGELVAGRVAERVGVRL
jgi:hypothetical protein